jgi:nitrile hydratase accessory protein
VTEVGDARRRVEALLTELPGEGGDLGFEQPWELRAFALAVAAYHAGQYDWSEFQLALIGSIRRWEEAGAPVQDAPWRYYDHWLAALETTLAGAGALAGGELDERTATVLANPPHRGHVARTEPVAVDPAVSPA